MEGALRLGLAKAPGAAARLVERLAVETDRVAAGGICAAIELCDDRSVVPRLAELLATAPEDHVWAIGYVVGVLSGCVPLEAADPDVEVQRRAWQSAASQPTEPAVVAMRAESWGVHFSVQYGRGRIRFVLDPPSSAKTSWPRWDRSLRIDGQPLYAIGSICGTCETVLTLLGWRDAQALSFGRELARSCNDPTAPSEQWVRQAAPLLTELQTGRYLAAVVELVIERVDSIDDSWMSLRGDRRQSDDDWGPDEHYPSWPGTPYFQGPHFAGTPATYWVMLPSQPLTDLHEPTVQAYMDQIRAGERPTALVLGWLEDVYVECEWEERFVMLCVLDGHHKLEAYARLRRPARVVTVFALDHSSGPPPHRDRFVREALAQVGRDCGENVAEFRASSTAADQR